jgi:hypothetical protein
MRLEMTAMSVPPKMIGGHFPPICKGHFICDANARNALRVAKRAYF